MKYEAGEPGTDVREQLKERRASGAESLKTDVSHSPANGSGAPDTDPTPYYDRDPFLNPVDLEFRETAIIRQSLSVSGPLPPPDQLRQYGEIEPTAPDRIIKMAENEQNFRHDQAEVDHSAFRTGQYLGFTLSTLSIVLAGVLAFNGKLLIPAILLGAPVLAHVQSFYRRHHGGSEADKRETKAESEEMADRRRPDQR